MLNLFTDHAADHDGFGWDVPPAWKLWLDQLQLFAANSWYTLT